MIARAIARCSWTVALSGALMSACADRKPTAITLAIESEPAVPKEVDTISIEVTRDGKVSFARSYQVDRVTGTVHLPGTLTIEPGAGASADAPVTVRIRANLKGSQVALRTATLGFAEEKTKLLRMPLRYSCYDFPDKCGEGQTCVGGACATSAVPVDKLPDYAQEPVFVTRAPGAACFDALDTVCGSARSTVDLTGFAASGCVLDVAKGPREKLNVFVRYSASTDQSHLTPLDQDPDEGFTSDPAAPQQRVKLAPGLCEGVKGRKITRVEYNFACPTKTPQLPVCQPAANEKPVGTLVDSACQKCVYQPTDCQKELAAAMADAASKSALTCAFACPFDGRYDTVAECDGVGRCFFDCLNPPACTAAQGCTSAAISTWAACLASLSPIAERCASPCGPSGENALSCPGAK